MHFEQQLHTAGGTCRNAKNFPIFEEETALFQHAIKLLFDEGDPHFLPLCFCCMQQFFLLMGAGAVYFIKILHQHFDDNDL